MKEILKKIYKEKFIQNVSDFNFAKFYYFIDDKQIFGISKDIITDNELKLILTHYELLTEDILPEKSTNLIDFLFGKSKKIPDYKRIKYFFIKGISLFDEEIISEFDNLLKDVFKNYLSFIKIKNIYILLINDENDLLFEEILKSVESDFLVPIIGFESDFYRVDNTLPHCFQTDFKAFQNYKKTSKLLINKIDLIKHNLLNSIDKEVKHELKQYVLKSFVNDYEMLNVIKTYFTTNLNTTLAAKKCFMHRNTFINKIDKFIETTHFNIRNYDEAFIVYLTTIL